MIIFFGLFAVGALLGLLGLVDFGFSTGWYVFLLIVNVLAIIANLPKKRPHR
jgi:hypothetical protein